MASTDPLTMTADQILAISDPRVLFETDAAGLRRKPLSCDGIQTVAPIRSLPESRPTIDARPSCLRKRVRLIEVTDNAE